MQFLAPLEGFDPTTWMERLRVGGVSPADAMKIYDEMRTFGHQSIRREPVSDMDAQWDEMRVRLCKHLRTIETPEDFQGYRKNIQNALFDVEPPKRVDAHKMQPFLTRWMESGNAYRIGREDIIDMVSGRFQFKQKEEWLAWDDIGMEWEDVEAAMAADRLVQPTHLNQALTAEGAKQALMTAVEKSGLAGLEWNMIDGTSPQVLWNLSVNIEQANAALEDRTGWKGPVLGLGGKVVLRAGLERSGNGGTASSMHTHDAYHLSMEAKTGWGVVSHEWLHCLDFAMGYEPGQRWGNLASHMKNDSANIKPWSELMKRLNGYRMDTDTADLIKNELTVGLRQRWSGDNLPEGMSDLVVNLIHQHPSSITGKARKDQLDLLVAHFKEHAKGNSSNFEIKAEVAMTEMDIIREQQDYMEKGGSLWIQFAQRFKDNLKFHHTAAISKEWGGYFQEPCEQAAHSFEATFAKQGVFITDVDPEKSSMRYPLPGEARAQGEAWSELFEQATPWWEKLPGAQVASSISAEVGGQELESRLAKRRATKTAQAKPKTTAGHQMH